MQLQTYMCMYFSGLTFSPSPDWISLRRFTLRHLRDEGMGKQHLESEINEETKAFIDTYIEPSLGKPISNLRILLQKLTTNIMGQMIFGGRRDYHDPELNQLVNAISNIVRLDASASLTRKIPLSWLLPFHNTLKTLSTYLENLLLREVDHHKTCFNPENCVDIYDNFMLKQQEEYNKERDVKCFSGMYSWQIHCKGDQSIF